MKKRVLHYQLAVLISIIYPFYGCDSMFDNSYEYENIELYSEHTGTTYSINIFYPSHYVSGNEYHVVYLLDGDFHFSRSLDIVSSYDDVILIGVGYAGENYRAVDFTYPEDDVIGVEESGEAIPFIRFLSDELKPYISDELNINQQETTLVGHSLSAYFTLFILFQNEVDISFDNIISASPSLFWADSYILELENTYSVENDSLDVNLYLSMGDLDALHMNLLFTAFTSSITNSDYQGLKLQYETLSGTSHMRSLSKSLKRGLEYFEGLKNE